MPDIDLPTVIFALVALFVAYKLRSVLGMRNDGERPPGGLLAPLRRVPGSPPLPRARPPRGRKRRGHPRARAAAADRWQGVAEPDGVWSGLDAIAARGPRLSRRRRFCPAPARPTTWSSTPSPPATRDTLAGLMAPEAFANFDAAIRARAAAGHTMTTTVVSIDDAKIAGRPARRARPRKSSVRFASKLASVTRDAAGDVVDGSATEVADHLDLWTFARDVRSRDPNWRLTATQAER